MIIQTKIDNDDYYETPMVIKIIGTRDQIIQASGEPADTPMEDVQAELKRVIIDTLDDAQDLPGYNVEIEITDGESK